MLTAQINAVILLILHSQPHLLYSIGLETGTVSHLNCFVHALRSYSTLVSKSTISRLCLGSLSQRTTVTWSRPSHTICSSIASTMFDRKIRGHATRRSFPARRPLLGRQEELSNRPKIEHCPFQWLVKCNWSDSNLLIAWHYFVIPLCWVIWQPPLFDDEFITPLADAYVMFACSEQEQSPPLQTTRPRSLEWLFTPGESAAILHV